MLPVSAGRSPLGGARLIIRWPEGLTVVEQTPSGSPLKTPLERVTVK